jgi:hypothetical protein
MSCGACRHLPTNTFMSATTRRSSASIWRSKGDHSRRRTGESDPESPTFHRILPITPGRFLSGLQSPDPAVARKPFGYGFHGTRQEFPRPRKPGKVARRAIFVFVVFALALGLLMKLSNEFHLPNSEDAAAADIRVACRGNANHAEFD